MADTRLNPDFAEFLKLLNSHQVEYLVIGGYAVAYHGYPRPTGDLDVWISAVNQNVERLVSALKQFGFDMPELKPELFAPGKIVRMGVTPARIEILRDISGVTFDDAFERRLRVVLGGVECWMISLADLRRNKRESGRAKDVADLENLP